MQNLPQRQRRRQPKTDTLRGTGRSAASIMNKHGNWIKSWGQNGRGGDHANENPRALPGLGPIAANPFDPTPRGRCLGRR